MSVQGDRNFPNGTRRIFPTVVKRTSGSDPVEFTFTHPDTLDELVRKVNVVQGLSTPAVLEVPVDYTDLRVVSDHVDVNLDLAGEIRVHVVVIDKLTTGPNDLSLNRVHLYPLGPSAVGSLYVINFTDKVTRVEVTDGASNVVESQSIAVSAGYEFVNPTGLTLADREDLADWDLGNDVVQAAVMGYQVIGDPPEESLLYGSGGFFYYPYSGQILVFMPPRRPGSSILDGTTREAVLIDLGFWQWRWQYFAPALG